MESHFVFINDLWASQRHLVSHCGNRKIDQINLGANYVFLYNCMIAYFFDFFFKNVTHAWNRETTILVGQRNGNVYLILSISWDQIFFMNQELSPRTPLNTEHQKPWINKEKTDSRSSKEIESYWGQQVSNLLPVPLKCMTKNAYSAFFFTHLTPITTFFKKFQILLNLTDSVSKEWLYSKNALN